MLNTIIDLLRASTADAWEVTDIQETGWEFYLIRHRLDQHRAKLTRHTHVKVYRRFGEGKFLGSASAEIPPTATAAEAKATVDALCQRAEYVKNPAYTLVTPDGEAQAQTGSVDVAAIARDFLEAVQAVPETATEDINSYEIFVSEKKRRFVNSEGVDVVSVYPSSMAEVVVNARRDGHEIELYRLYHSGACDKAGLTQALTETLRYSRDKLIAQPTPALGQATVLFSTDAACEIYNYFISRMSAAMLVRRISDWQIGEPVVKDAEGDLVTVRALVNLPNSADNAAYDPEGARRWDFDVIENGIARQSFGSRQFSQYLGLERSCIPGNYAVSGGSQDAAALRSGPYLEVVEFSDFQVHPMSGDIAGEIRLGYWHDGEKTIPVSGGSVTGSMLTLAKTMRMSREQRQYNNLLIPAVTALSGVTIAGVE